MGFFGHILHGYIYISSSFIFEAQAGVCGIISQLVLNKIWIWWSKILIIFTNT